jgi:hypothetical protein
MTDWNDEADEKKRHSASKKLEFALMNERIRFLSHRRQRPKGDSEANAADEKCTPKDEQKKAPKKSELLT